MRADQMPRPFSSLHRPDIKDPVESVIAEALSEANIPFRHESDHPDLNLDFEVTGWDVFIECKQFHADRISQQMKKAEDVIAVQGMQAAQWLATVIRFSAKDPTND